MHYPIKYYAKKESLTIEYNNQYICYHSFGLKNKKPFREFAKEILVSQPQDINKVFEMARNPHISVQSTKSACKIIY